MDRRLNRHWSDGLAELLGAAALGLGASVSASLVALRSGFAVAPVSVGAAAAGLAVGWVLMRAVPADEAVLALPEFEVGSLQLAQEPEALLLDDSLAGPTPGSRVVQLFAPEAMPTPGQLRASIDRHLGEGEDAAAAPISADATDALHAALDEIRRSLGRG